MNKILVIQTASIGDVILATPVIEKLHHNFPGAEIDFLMKRGNEELFRGHPFLHQLLIWDKRNNKFSDFLYIFLKIRKNRYDLVINIQRFALTGILTAFSGARMTIGFNKNPFSHFFTKRIEHVIKPGVHEVQRNLSLVTHFPGKDLFAPKLYPGEADIERVAEYKTGIYYTISPASLWFTKQYPLENWAEFIGTIASERRVYLLGSKADIPICEEIIHRSGNASVINLAGKLTFLESAALMKDARMNFTNDSAPMHLASGVNAPVTVIFCSTVPEFGFGPLSVDSTIVETHEKLDCRPCGLHGFQQCPEKHFKCALTISLIDLSSRL